MKENSMKTVSPTAIATKITLFTAAALMGSFGIIPAAANALSLDGAAKVTTPYVKVDANANASTNSTSTSTSNEKARLQNIISKGDQEIARRLASLSMFLSKINAATKLTASDKATLTAEVNATIDGLNALKVKLDGETTVAAARTDAQSIYTEYRVYALVAPKVALVKVADDQQVAEQKLQTLIQKFQARLNAAKAKGKDVSALETTLSDMTQKVSASASVSSAIQAKVIDLQPTDYNNDHAILSGDSAQLKTAHADNVAAYQDAKQIVAGLKGL
jgi:hypothetical protein